MSDVTLHCELELSKLTEPQKNALYAEVGAIAHNMAYCSPDSRKAILNVSFSRLCKSLAEKCPGLREIDIRLIGAILLNCIDELIISRAEVIERILPELSEISVHVREARLRRKLLEAEERHQEKIDQIEDELKQNDWKDQKDGKAERELTLLHAVTRARYTPLASKTIGFCPDKTTRYGNHKKYKRYTIDTN